MLAAELQDRNAAFMLLQNPDDLLFTETIIFHSLVLDLGQNVT
jgi:hypothetical protein